VRQVRLEASGHPLIVEMWTGLNGQMGALMRSSLDRQKIGLQETVRMHAGLITVFREQPASVAVSALRDHYIGEDA